MWKWGCVPHHSFLSHPIFKRVTYSTWDISHSILVVFVPETVHNRHSLPYFVFRMIKSLAFIAEYSSTPIFRNVFLRLRRCRNEREVEWEGETACGHSVVTNCREGFVYERQMSILVSRLDPTHPSFSSC